MTLLPSGEYACTIIESVAKLLQACDSYVSRMSKSSDSHSIHYGYSCILFVKFIRMLMFEFLSILKTFDVHANNPEAKGMVWYGMVWYGMVWYGMVWYGMVWYGMVWYGMAWYGMWHGMVWYGMVWYGTVWYGIVWYGMAWYSMVRYGMV